MGKLWRKQDFSEPFVLDAWASKTNEKSPKITNGHCELGVGSASMCLSFTVRSSQVRNPLGEVSRCASCSPHPLSACLISLKSQWKHWVGQTLALKLVHDNHILLVDS